MVVLRTVAGLTALALALAGCGAPAGTAAPVFVDPSVASSGPQPLPSAASTTASPSASASRSPSRSPSAKPRTSSKPPKTVRYAFPVDASNVAFHPTHSKYPATDIFADCGERVVATTGGVVLEVSRTDRYVKGAADGPLNGGLSVSIRGDDGVRYYGSHLSRVESAIKPGVRVAAGRLLGEVGRTGNANNVCHLHFGISPPCAETGDWKVRRGVIWPAKYLTSWRKKGTKSPAAEVAEWAADKDCEA